MNGVPSAQQNLLMSGDDERNNPLNTHSLPRDRPVRLGVSVGLVATLVVALMALATAAANAEGFPSGKARGWNDNTFEAYVKKGETLTLTAKYAYKTSAQATHTLRIRGLGGVAKNCTISAAYVAGKGCTVTATAAQTGVMTAEIDSAAPRVDQNAATPATAAARQSTQYHWDVTVKAGSAVKPGRVWSPQYLRVGQDANDNTPAKVRAGAADLNLFFLDNRGWAYRAKYTGYNGVYSHIIANNLGLVQSSNGQQALRSAFENEALTYQGKNNKDYWIFLNRPAADLPATAKWPNGSTRTLSRMANPIVPSVTGAKFTRNGTATMAGKLTFTLKDYEGDVLVQFDTNRDGSYTAADRQYPLKNVTGAQTVSFDGKGPGGGTIAKGPLSARVTIPSYGEIHFISRDVEKRSGIEVQRLNGPAAGRTTLRWNDTGLGAQGSTTPRPDGRAGVNSTGGVHGWREGGPSGMTGHGNNRNIQDWTQIDVPVVASINIPGDPPPPAEPRLQVDKVQAGDPVEVDALDDQGNPIAGPTTYAPATGEPAAGASLVTREGTEGAYTYSPVAAGAQLLIANPVADDPANPDPAYQTYIPAPSPVPAGAQLFVEDGTQYVPVYVATATTKKVLRVPYRITVKSTLAANSNVVVTDFPLDGLNADSIRFVSATKGTWDPAIKGLRVGNMATNEVQSLNVTVDTPVDAPIGEVRRNLVIASSTENPKPAPTNPGTAPCQINGTVDLDVDQCDVVEDSDPDMRIWKALNDGMPQATAPGEEVEFLIRFGNFGGAPDRPVTVKDFPEVEKFVPGSMSLTDPSAGTIDGLTLTLPEGLDAGERGHVTFTGTVAEGAVGPIFNHATITSPEDPVDPDRPEVCVDNDTLEADDDNCDVAQIPLAPPADVKIEKLEESAKRIGKDVQITYTLKVTNDSEARAARDVAVKDTYPVGTDPTSVRVTAGPSKGEFTEATGDWKVTDRLEPKAFETVGLTLLVKNPPKDKAIVNTATVTSPDDPHVPGVCVPNTGDIHTDDDNCDQVETPVPGEPDIKVNKRDSAEDKGKARIKTEGPRTTITYTIEGGNYGEGDDENAVLLDQLPAKQIGVKILKKTRGSLVVDGDEIKWTLPGVFKAGERVSATFDVTFRTADIVGKDVINHVTITSEHNPYVPGDKCELNETLDKDKDQCDEVVTTIPADSPEPPVVDPPKDPGGFLPNTGGPQLTGLLVGLGLLVTGGALAYRNRRRKEDYETSA